MDRKVLDERLVKVLPSERQLAHQEMEFYAFIHYTVNTYTDKEWGEGTEEPSIVNPDSLDPAQWVESIKAAGMKGLILTCKHHDGFCLWPSKYTDHTIAQSPYKEGKGDIVREVAEACRQGGIQFGVYLSPWDRNNHTYGMGKEYNDYFINQLTELLTEYGDIFSVWFDGACGEGKNGKKQVYDWDRYYELIRRLQPNACITICGPDIRWCGNEAGQTRESEWSVVPKRASETEKIASLSQQSDDEAFRERKISATDSDLGSRIALANETDLMWYPAEVDTSIRPGWFYHQEEDGEVKSLEKLLHIYFNSVGGNAILLLNLPPDKHGRIHENDAGRLKELGDYIRNAFSVNLMEQAEITADTCEKGYEINNVRQDSYDSFYKTEEGIQQAEINIHFHEPVKVSYVVLKENIRLSQRIEEFEIRDEEDHILYQGTIVGYKKIVLMKGAEVSKLKICVKDSRVCPTLSFIGVY